jgi:hypothetical protein
VSEWVESTVNVRGVRFVVSHKTIRPSVGNAAIGRVARRLRHHGATVALHAHYHEPMALDVDGEIVAVWNGSLGGPNEHACELGYYNPPTQAMFRCGNGPIRVEDMRWLKW